jgi:hypothetical protein
MADSCSDKKCLFSKCFSKKCSIVAVLAVVAGVVSLWFVWFGASSLINKEIVEENIQRLAVQVSDVANGYGKDAKLAYGEVEITGWGYSKKAVVHNPSLDVAIKGSAAGKGWLVATDSVVVEADPISVNRIIISAAEPVNISEDGKAKSVVTFAEPLKYTYMPLNAEGLHASQQDILFPKQITISKVGGAAVDCASDASVDCAHKAAEAPKGQSVISFANVPTLHIISSVEKNKNIISYDFSGMEVVSDDGSKTAVGSLLGKFNKYDGDNEGQFFVQYNLALADVVVSDAAHASKPYAFNADMGIVGDVVTKSEPIVAPAVPPVAGENLPPEQAKAPVATFVNKKITVKEVALSGQDFKLHVSGDVSVLADDALPSGLLTFQIDNLQKFLSSELVPAEVRGVLEGLLEKMTGQPISQQENVTIDFKREKNGVFYLGKTTFEALASTFLSDMLMNRSASEQPRVGEPKISEPTVLPRDLPKSEGVK